MNNTQKIITWTARILVGVLFIISGFVKANDFVGFSYKLNEYWIVFNVVDFMAPFSKFLAGFISVLEIAMGVALLVGYRMRELAWMLLGMILFFTFLTWYSWYFEAVQDCGCFGDAIKLTPFESFMKDLILLVLILPIFIWKDKIQPIVSGSLPMIISIGSFILFAIFSWRCYTHLPWVDFRPYAIGEDMKHNTIPSDKNNWDPKAHDYPPAGMECDSIPLEEFEGKSLFIIAPYMDEMSDDSFKELVKLTNSLKGTDVKVYMASSSISDVVNAKKAKFNIDLCIGGMDETVLKTMVRSNPGYFTTNNGIIKGKWHSNDIPDKAELLSAF